MRLENFRDTFFHNLSIVNVKLNIFVISLQIKILISFLVICFLEFIINS